MTLRVSCLIVTISSADNMEQDAFQYVPVGDKDAGTVRAMGVAAPPPPTLKPWGHCLPPNSYQKTYSRFIIVTTSIQMCFVDVSQQLQNTSFHCPELTDFRTRLVISVLLGSFH